MAQNQPNHSFQRSQSADLPQPQPRILLTIHSSNTLPTMAAPASFQRRTVESARQLRERCASMIREIEPLVETARTMNVGVTSFLNSSQPESNISGNSSTESYSNSFSNSSSGDTRRSDSYFIDLEMADNTRDNSLAPNPEEYANNENNINPPNIDNNNTNEDTDRMQTVIEFQQFLKVVLKYMPFVLILLAKAVYDYHEGIFNLLILFVTFAHANSTVKKEAIKRQRRSISNLAIELLYIIACLVFIHYVFSDDLQNFHIVLNLVLIRTFTHPLTVWNLLWIVTITDFVLKLFTVTIKIFLTMLPASIVEFKKRGKIYLFIEAISQMYRSIATIQPWLYYLLESYQGPERIVAVFLSAFYMTSKGAYLMAKVTLLKKAFFKLLQNVSIGSSPNKDQIQTAGEHCPICHDEYDSPVLLQCRHIFCESCVSTWFDREQTCPLCRAKIVDDPSWRDGSTAYFVQLF